MPLQDLDLQRIIAASFNENLSLTIDGTERIDQVCKEIANRTFREWAAATDSAPMKSKLHPVIIVSVHQTEPPTAISGDHCHFHKNENKWRAYEFVLPNGWFVLIKFGVQQGKLAERACLSHFNDFMA